MPAGFPCTSPHIGLTKLCDIIKYLLELPTEEELKLEIERERRLIESKRAAGAERQIADARKGAGK